MQNSDSPPPARGSANPQPELSAVDPSALDRPPYKLPDTREDVRAFLEQAAAVPLSFYRREVIVRYLDRGFELVSKKASKKNKTQGRPVDENTPTIDGKFLDLWFARIRGAEGRTWAKIAEAAGAKDDTALRAQRRALVGSSKTKQPGALTHFDARSKERSLQKRMLRALGERLRSKLQDDRAEISLTRERIVLFGYVTWRLSLD